MQREDPRIKIINNPKNYGILYSIAIGILDAKGNYITNLDHDDLFLDEDILSTTYVEAEKGNFDILTFLAICASDYYTPINKMKDVFLIILLFINLNYLIIHYLKMKNFLLLTLEFGEN